jgi:hypothetical protein
MPRRDDDYEDDDDDRDIRSRRRRPLRRYEEDDEDDEDYDDDDEPSVGGKIIPYKNGWALGAYYGGFLSIILVLAALAMGVAAGVDSLPKIFTSIAIGVAVLGILAGPIAAILGVVGMRYARRHRQAAGGGHAIVGILIGVLATLVGLLLVIGLAVFSFSK